MKTRHMPLLAEIPKTNIDEETLAYIDRAAEASLARSTLFRGLVTGKLWIVFHAGIRPTPSFVRRAEAEELRALPTVGAMQ